MILSRITKAVREQNWFAVAIEFVIVILGVVIGFQVNAWNEGRLQRIRQAELVVRLEADFRTIEADALEALRFTRQRILEADRLILGAGDGFASYGDAGLFDDLSRVFNTRGPVAGSGTYQELLASGELSRLDSSDLKAALGRFARSYDRFVAANTGLTSSYSDYRELFSAFSIVLLTSESDRLPPFLAEQANDIVRRPSFLESVTRFRAIQANNYYWHRLTLTDARRVLDALGATPEGGDPLPLPDLLETYQ